MTHDIRLTKKQKDFLKTWTWVDSANAKRAVHLGDAAFAFDWARSAAHDVLHAVELVGLIEPEETL